MLVSSSQRSRKSRRCAPAIDFTMKEQFSGLLLPLVRASLSDFGPIVSRFGEDLKHEAKRASP
jgi:hypothetical protein